MTYKHAFRSKQEDKLNEAVTKFTEDQKKAVAETERAALLQRQEKIEKVRLHHLSEAFGKNFNSNKLFAIFRLRV